MDKAQATAHSLLCTNTPGVLDDSVAEHTINLLFAAARQTVAQAARLRAGEWAPQMGERAERQDASGHRLRGDWTAVAQMAARGLGMKVIGCEVADLDVKRMQQEFGFAGVVKDFAEAVGGGLCQPAHPVSAGDPALPERRAAGPAAGGMLGREHSAGRVGGRGGAV